MSEVAEAEVADLILTNPKGAVLGARIGWEEADKVYTYILSVETTDDYDYGLATTLGDAKKLFANNYYKGAKWEYEV